MLVVVFPDGETFNTVQGCIIANVPDGLDTIEDIELALEEQKYDLVQDLGEAYKDKNYPAPIS